MDSLSKAGLSFLVYGPRASGVISEPRFGGHDGPGITGARQEPLGVSQCLFQAPVPPDLFCVI